MLLLCQHGPGGRVHRVVQSATVVQQEPVIRAARVRGWVAAPVAADIITDIKDERESDGH